MQYFIAACLYRYVHCPIDPDEPPAVPQPLPKYPYRTVGCVFNHQSFYANSQVISVILDYILVPSLLLGVQPSDSLDCCQFALLDETLWKCMSSDAIRSVCDVHLQVR